MCRGARPTWRRQEQSGSASGAGNNYFSTEYTSSTQIRAGPSSSSGALPIAAVLVPAAPASNKVRFNGAQLTAVPVPVPVLASTATAPTASASAGNKKVSFNGASLVLEQVTLPVPAPPAARVSTGLPLPKVSVSTASGERLRPPPRVVVAAGGNATAESDFTESDVVGETSAVTEVDEESIAVEVLNSAVSHLEIIDTVAGSEEGREVVGSFQMSEDGAAMLFSTG